MTELTRDQKIDAIAAAIDTDPLAAANELITNPGSPKEFALGLLIAGGITEDEFKPLVDYLNQNQDDRSVGEWLEGFRAEKGIVWSVDDGPIQAEGE